MRVVAIGDIGVADDMIHIGDEAMFEALVRALRRRGVEYITGLSSAPSDSAARYGIEGVSLLGFGRDRGANEHRRNRIVQGRLDDSDPANAVIAAVREADGVVIAGGGNMASTWPQHIAERATLGELASMFGVALVVTGQTLGPELNDADRLLVKNLLSRAALVGVREPATLALCHDLGLTGVEQTVDDASFLGVEDGIPDAAGSGILVSASSHVGVVDREAFAAAVAALLDALAAETGQPVRFLAHWGSIDPGASRGDSVLHDQVREAMHHPATVVTPTDSLTAAALARESAMVVSSRYHPVVFAVPAGVPALAIPVDEYTSVKLHGALHNFGQRGILPVDDLLAGSGAVLGAQLWRKRELIRATARAGAAARVAASSAWWDRVMASFASR